MSQIFTALGVESGSESRIYKRQEYLQIEMKLPFVSAVMKLPSISGVWAKSNKLITLCRGGGSAKSVPI
jgi:hypothetical protein